MQEICPVAGDASTILDHRRALLSHLGTVLGHARAFLHGTYGVTHDRIATWPVELVALDLCLE